MSKPIVLIAEELSPATVEALGPDFEVRNVDGTDRAALLKELATANAALKAAQDALASEKAGRALDSATATSKAAADAITAKAAADLAKATYKAEYNALATKWNKKFPKLKVALKK